MAMYNPTHVGVFTSTTSSQALTLEAGARYVRVINAASNPLYLKFAASVAIPTTLASGEGVRLVKASAEDTFELPASIQSAGGSLAYIAATAGGAMTVVLGKDA